jgi:hypothetical protein
MLYFHAHWIGKNENVELKCSVGYGSMEHKYSANGSINCTVSTENK